MASGSLPGRGASLDDGARAYHIIVRATDASAFTPTGTPSSARSPGARSIRSTGPVPPEGARLMLAGPANPGWRVISLWDSDEARERFFAERLAPAYQEAGLSLDGIERTLFDVHLLAEGDLGGTPLPA